jgi:putative FmdB family regulatory protein
MPIYEYTCNNCGQEFEALVRGSEKPACPSCGEGNLSKQISVPAAHSAGGSQAACPARDACGVQNCCGGSCGMADWG